MVGKVWRPALALGVVLAIVFWVDRWIGRIEQGGPYREAIRAPLERAKKARQAQHIVLGASTSNWFPPVIARQRKVPKSKVLDAHMSDCHQSCTMAEAVALRRQGHHYQTATFGVNMFEYCEKYRARRVMQEVELLPFDESLRLLPIYAASDDPLRIVGGWMMNQLSDVYGNTMWLQRHHRKAWFGKEALSSSWFRSAAKVAKKRRPTFFECDYLQADRRFGLAATRAALQAASELADQVYLVVLPDRAYCGEAAPAVEAREAFRAEHAVIAGALERVQLLDLSEPSVAREQHFRDNAHLNSKGIKAAAKLLEAKLSAALLSHGRGP